MKEKEKDLGETRGERPMSARVPQMEPTVFAYIEGAAGIVRGRLTALMVSRVVNFQIDCYLDDEAREHASSHFYEAEH